MPQRFRAACATAAAMGAALAGLALPATAHAATTCADGVWKATYYPNTSFSGTPKLTTCDSSINENYGTGDPAGVTLPKDNFTVRWQTTRDFGSGGPFTFTTAVQDGIRVYLDGVRKIDVWKNVSTTQTKTLNLTVPKGRHTIRVDFVAFTGSANVKFTYAPRTTAGVDKVKPLAPTGGKTAYSTTTYRPTVTWSRNKEMDVAGYRVKRCSTQCTWQTVSGSALVTGTSFTDVPLADGRFYSYAVAAVDKAGNESALGGAKSVVTTDLPDPAAPAGLKAADTAKGIALTWTPSAGATRYGVTRQEGDILSWITLGTPTTASFTDTTAKDNTRYTYFVRALDGYGNVSTASSVGITRGDHRAPGAPTGLTATPVGDYGVKLAWTRPTGSGTGVRVYRSTTSPVSTSGTPITSCSANYSATACTDSGNLQRGVTYHYVVTQVNMDGVQSAPSNEVTFTVPGDSTPPAAVTGLTATATEYGIKVDWNDSPEPDLKRYELYRGELIQDDEDTVIMVRTIEYLGPDTSEFLYQGLPDGDTWAFFVVAVDKWGHKLPYQTVPGGYVTATEPDLAPTVETSDGSPLELTAAAAAPGPGVALSWTCATGCGDITGFRIHRWDRASGTYVELTDAPLPAGTTAFTDAAVPAGSTYFYRVTAVHADGTESVPATDWAALPPTA
ncbi:PA14 domain-containing protein [Streptomyces sp. NPDC048411]|uniref:fibronectin type III domain-containing protein n=1 Tax=Streptomyces sp. NPDC048411 TaxID=3157206 RepID=UPI003453A33A